jgi:hypothetical protein
VTAALAVAAGIVALIVLTREPSDEASTTPAIDAAVSHVVPPAIDAAVVEAVPDAAVVATPQCFVDVTTNPTGAEIVRDKDVLGTAPAKLPLPCGEELRLTFRKARFGAVTRATTPTPDGPPLKVTLQHLMFTVKVSSQPTGATITLNGKSLGVTPTVVKLPAFELSTLILTKDGFSPDTQKVTPKQNNLAVQSQLKKKLKTR